MKFRGYRSGFTIIELLMVVSIIGIISMVAVPAFQKYVFDAREAEGTKILLEAWRDQQRVKQECEVGKYTCPKNPDGTGALFTELMGSGDPDFPSLLYQPGSGARFNLVTGNLAPAFASVSGAKYSSNPGAHNLFGYLVGGGGAPDYRKYLMGVEAELNGNLHVLAIDEKGVLYKICDAWTGESGPGQALYQSYTGDDPICGAAQAAGQQSCGEEGC